jgi:energy-coupling factor transporter ATP-binding protein EcfA2
MRVYITSEIKDEFRLMCETKGVTQSEMIEKLIKEAVNQHECLVKD